MAQYLGQSGNMMNFMDPSGNMINVAPNSLAPDYAQSLQDQARNPANNPAVQFMNQQPGMIAANQVGLANPSGGMLLADNSGKVGMGDSGLGAGKPDLVFAGQRAKPQVSSVGLNTSSLMGGFDKEMAGVAQESAAKSNAASEQAKLFGEQAAMTKNYAEQAKAQNEAFFGSYEQEVNKLKGMTDSFMKQSNINPNAIWENSSTGAKIGAGIGVALGALGAALTGGQNQALAIIDKAIERDIESQKLNIDKSRGALGVQSGLVGQLREQFNDKRMADAAAYKIAYDEAENRLKQIVANSENPALQGRAQQLMGQIQQKRGVYEVQFAQQARSMAALSSLGAGGQIDAGSLNALPKEMQDKVVRLGDNRYALAINESAAREMQSTLPAMEQALDKINYLMKESEFEILPTNKKGALSAAASNLITDLKNMEKTGALDKGTIEIMDRLIGDPTAFLQSNFKGKIEQLQKMLLHKKNMFIKQNIPGYMPTEAQERPGMSQGGYVGGGEVVEGDHPANDTVPAMLSPGEIVIPKSLVEASDEEILNFIKKHRK